jgi:threonine/homoserine/homoserine lactone efflux protein
MVIKSQKLRAAGMVAGMLTISVSVVLMLKLAFTYLTVDTAPYAVAVVVLSGAMYLLYSIALSQIQYEDKLKDLGKK